MIFVQLFWIVIVSLSVSIQKVNRPGAGFLNFFFNRRLTEINSRDENMGTEASFVTRLRKNFPK